MSADANDRHLGSGEGKPLLFQPITLREITARNRIVVSPMCQYVSEDGAPTDWHLVHLGQFAINGAGIVFCEETAIEARGRKTYGCAGLYTERQVRANRRITDFLKTQNAVPAIQLGHSGRKAACRPPWDGFAPLNDTDARNGRPGWQGLSSSAIPVREDAIVPRALGRSEIRDVLSLWRDAALRAIDAGYDICEVHGAHGYLIHQFLSPLVNQRSDAYGGDLAGRMRLALEIAEVVRTTWPQDKPLFFRISAIDGPWTIEDSVELAKELKIRGIDVVDCSSGGIKGAITAGAAPRPPGYQVPFAQAIRRGAAIATMAVGLITDPRHAESILQSGDADLIALARELMFNPNWPVQAARALGVSNYLDLLPRNYAWWLKRREATSLSPHTNATNHNSDAPMGEIHETRRADLYCAKVRRE